MADIQQEDARNLLIVIASAAAKGQVLTYSGAAKLLGRLPPERHSRATAQMCDLLDAAACLAGVPLLALIAVRDKSGEINPKAWKKEYGPRRDAIINRSLQHHFLPADYDSISNAIDDLGKRGNRRAWRYLESLYPGDLLYRRLTATYTEGAMNAVDDLGTDTPDRARSQSWSYARDPQVRDAVLKRADGRCEYCGQLGFIKADGNRYLETHHIIALANDGADRVANVIAVCPNHHREAHYGVDSECIEKEMIAKLKRVAH